jgi:hypothetical protein
VESPAPDNGADNSQQDVKHDARSSPVYDLAADEPGNQAENDPSQCRRTGLSVFAKCERASPAEATLPAPVAFKRSFARFTPFGLSQ